MTPEEYTLAPLPAFCPQEKQRSLHKHDTPFPGDTGMLEHIVVDDLTGVSIDYSRGNDGT